MEYSPHLPIEQQVEILEKKKEDFIKEPNLDWKEKEIYTWIKKHNIPVPYDIKRNTKKYIIGELKAGNYIKG